MINAVIFIMFLFITILTVGLCSFIYSGKGNYSEGMILGIHVPADAAQAPDVKALTDRYKKSFRRFQRLNLAAGVATCGLCLLNTGIGMFLYTLWILEYAAGVCLLTILVQRKMYKVKIRHQWFTGEIRPATLVDTRVSAMAQNFPISWKWHLPILLVWIVVWILTLVRSSFVHREDYILLLICFIPPFFLFLGLHILLSTRKNRVYSKDSRINEQINYLEKHTWSRAFLIADYASAAAGIYLLLRLAFGGQLFLWDYGIYIAVDMIGAVALIFSILRIRLRRKEILDQDDQPVAADDDEYWKNGWYSNPNDRHLWVQNRMCSTNYTLNMAHPAAKWFLGITGILCAAAVIAMAGVAGVLFQLDSSRVSVNLAQSQGGGETITISYAFYKCSFQPEDIQELQLLDTLPEENFRRTNGGDTDRLLVGHFKGEITGDTMMFIYKNESPVIRIRLPQRTIFLNSDTREEIGKWYGLLEGLCENSP